MLRLRGVLLTILRLLRIESEAALNPSGLQKKVHPVSPAANGVEDGVVRVNTPSRYAL